MFQISRSFLKSADLPPAHCMVQTHHNHRVIGIGEALASQPCHCRNTMGKSVGKFMMLSLR